MDNYSDDILALLDGEPPARSRRPSAQASKRTSEALDRHLQQSRIDNGSTAHDDTGVLSGVADTWLSRVFHMDVQTIRRRLVGCPIVSKSTSGARYDVAEAAKYLVAPKMSVEQFVKQMKRGDLPPSLQDAFWSARLKQQKAEENAGDLWRSEDVMTLLLDVFRMIRDSFQVFPSTLEKTQDLSVEQQKVLIELLDELQATIHTTILKGVRDKQTRSAAAELEAFQLPYDQDVDV